MFSDQLLERVIQIATCEPDAVLFEKPIDYFPSAWLIGQASPLGL
jgi:hypothetical protein